MTTHAPPHETMDPVTRSQHQLERLQATLNRAFKSVPFYKERFEKHGIDPASIQTLWDLDKIPYTERRHLSDHYPYGMFAVPLRDVVRIHTAPGIRLNPTVAGYTKNDLAMWRDLVARALTAAGVDEHDIFQVHLEPGLANWGRDYKDGAESLGAGVIPLTPMSMQKQQMILKDYRTSVLVISPSSAQQLMEALFLSGTNPNELALDKLILVGEHTPEEARQRLEQELQCETRVHWGLSEVPGPALAFECPARQGLHFSEDYYFPEIINPATGERAALGEAGELVVTSLATRAFPLIRFRTGDRMRFFDQPCSCGLTLRRLEWLPGRCDDTVVIRGVKVHHEQITLHLERTLGFIPQGIRLSVNKEGAPGLEVRIWVDDALFSDEVKDLEQIITSVEHVLRQELGVPVHVRLSERFSESPRQAWVTDPEDYR